MKRLIFVLCVFLMSLPVINCSKSGEEAIPEEAPEEEIVDAVGESDSPTALSIAVQAFEDRDIALAKDLFCNMEGMADIPEARFGCAMATFFLMWGESSVNAILTGTNETPVNVQQAFFDEGGVFHKMSVRRSGEHYLNGVLICFNDLPFMEFATCSEEEQQYDETVYTTYSDGTRTSLGKIVPHMFCGMKAKGYGVQNLQSDLMRISQRFKAIYEILEPSSYDESFVFEIPKELFWWNEDVSITKKDVHMFAAGLSLGEFATKLAASYSWGVEADKICVNDKLGRDEALSGLNGAENNQPILTLLNKDAVSSLSVAYENLTSNALEGLNDIQATGSGDIDWGKVLLKSRKALLSYTFYAYKSSYDPNVIQNTIRLMDGLVASKGGPAAIGILGSTHNVKVDMKSFFLNPPDAGNVESDPFVLKYKPGHDTPQDGLEVVGGFFPYSFVEIFWKGFFEGFVSWQ